jgi:6-phosphogluconolactonase
MMRKFFLIITLFCGLFSKAQDYYLFIGTYTSGKSEGIYVYRFNLATGEANPVSVASGVSNPSYIAISPSRKYVYAVNENGGKQPGEVSAFAFDKKTGKLSFINKQHSGGDSPCYVSVDISGKWVVVGNYTGGNLSALPVNANGSLEPSAQLIQHTGISADKNRQEKAHVHATIFSPDYKYLVVPDLGMDKVMCYRFNAAQKKPLMLTPTTIVSVPPGNGPRHVDFHPSGKYMYLIEEMSGTVAAYKYNSGKISLIERTSSHPKDFSGEKGSADIHVSPDGKFLYASNRGDANNIAIFSIDIATGKLHGVGYQSVLGKTPRNFMITPNGKYLLVANQQSDNIVIFKRDSQTGLLTEAGTQINIPNPVCLKMIRAE